MLFDNTIIEMLPKILLRHVKYGFLNGKSAVGKLLGRLGHCRQHPCKRPLVTEFVMEVHYDNKTYAMVYVQSSRRDTGSLDKGCSRRPTSGGHLYVPSNDDEFDNVSPWTKGFFAEYEYNLMWKSVLVSTVLFTRYVQRIEARLLCVWA